MNLKIKFLLAFLSCSLITVCVIVFTLFAFRNIGAKTDMVQRDVKINGNINYFARELAKSRRSEKEFFIFPRNEKKQLRYEVAWKKSYLKMRDDFIPRLELLYKEANNTAALAELKKIRALMKENLAAFDTIAAKFQKTKSYDAVNKAEYGTFKDRTHTIEDFVDKAVQASMKDVRRGWQDISQMRRETGMILQIVFVAALLWGLLLAVIIAGRLSKSIVYLTKITDDISQGRLGEKIRLRRRDEIGKLAKSVGRLQKSMQLVMDKYRAR